MLIPTTYGAALMLMLLSMACWGSWANAQKLDGTSRFELFYVDYTVGLAVIAVLIGVTLGNIHPAAENSFWTNLHGASTRALLEALAGGLIFSVGNLLLVAAISVAGMAVAFPVGSGLGLVIGVALNYIVAPAGKLELIVGGVVLVVAAIVLDAMAYAEHEGTGGGAGQAKGGSSSEAKGIWLSLAGGLGAGLFYPPVARSMHGAGALTPYTVGVMFAVGALVSMVPMVTLLMRHPVQGAPLTWSDYRAQPMRARALAWAGGAVWGVGTAANFVASAVPLIGPATSFAMGDGNTMISAVWGVFVWKEFAGSSTRATWLLAAMFACFLAGLTAIALAPVVK